MVNSRRYVVVSEPSTARVSRLRLVSDRPGPTVAKKDVRSARPNVTSKGVFSCRSKLNDVRSDLPTVVRPSAKPKLPVPVEMRPALSGPPVP